MISEDSALGVDIATDLTDNVMGAEEFSETTTEAAVETTEAEIEEPYMQPRPVLFPVQDEFPPEGNDCSNSSKNSLTSSELVSFGMFRVEFPFHLSGLCGKLLFFRNNFAGVWKSSDEYSPPTV